MIPFIDLKLQHNLHREAIEKALLDTCASTKYILGPEVTRFEQSFATFSGVKHAVGVASGTNALRISCQALGIGPRDEILVPANTFIATALAVHETGALPVPVDVHPDTCLIDLHDLEKRITPRTKAIIPVHLFGQAINMGALVSFAEKHSLIIIEDACQAHGAKWNGRSVGSFGLAGCFSFYPSKNLGAFGDAGLITTNDSGLADELRKIRNYGSDTKNIHEFPGSNSRLDSIQASILNVKMQFLDKWNKKRFQVACQYVKKLENVEGIKLPAFDLKDSSRHVFHLFVIQSDRRDKLAEHLTKQGIQCGIHYPIPFHLQEAFAFLKSEKGSCPVSEKLATRILSLPMFPELTEKQINTVSNAIKAF